MIKEKEIEEHYHQLDTESLHVIKDELQWLLANSILNTSEQIRFINKTLSIRGENRESSIEKKLLIMCQCGSSRIIPVNCSDDNLKMMIFDEFMKPCGKCRQINKYSWKYLE